MMRRVFYHCANPAWKFIKVGIFTFTLSWCQPQWMYTNTQVWDNEASVLPLCYLCLLIIKVYLLFCAFALLKPLTGRLTPWDDEVSVLPLWHCSWPIFVIETNCFTAFSNYLGWFFVVFALFSILYLLLQAVAAWIKPLAFGWWGKYSTTVLIQLANFCYWN